MWHLINVVQPCRFLWRGALSVSCLQIGRILEIKRPIKKSQGAESVKVNVAWFYRPEESLGGRKVSVLIALLGLTAACHQPQPESTCALLFPSLWTMPGVSTLLHEPVCQAPASETSASSCHANHGSVPGRRCGRLACYTWPMHLCDPSHLLAVLPWGEGAVQVVPPGPDCGRLNRRALSCAQPGRLSGEASPRREASSLWLASIKGWCGHAGRILH